jgi:hypothetical protein
LRARNAAADDPGVGVVCADLSVAQRAAEAADDARPVAREESEQHESSRQVGRDQEGQEVVVVLMDVPPEDARQHHAVTEARDREQLREALEQTQHEGLEIGDRVHPFLTNLNDAT